MSKGLLTFFSLMVSVWGAFGWPFLQPVLKAILPASDEEAPISVIHRPAPTQKKEVVQEMAAFIEKNPNQFQAQIAGVKIKAQAITPTTENAPQVLGVTLNQKAQTALWGKSGKDALITTVKENPTLALQDLNQAWFATDPNDFQQRGALLEITNTIAEVSDDEAPRAMLYHEAETFITSTEHQNLEYGGRALQYYLNHETDPAKLQENLSKLGVEYIDPGAQNPQRVPAGQSEN